MNVIYLYQYQLLSLYMKNIQCIYLLYMFVYLFVSFFLSFFTYPHQNDSYEYIDIVSTASAVVEGSVYQGIAYSPHPAVDIAKVWKRI